MGVQHIQPAEKAFAAIWDDGSVVTRGHSDFGGDSSQVREQLAGVQHIQSTRNGAFAAILDGGSLLTWGNFDSGGDSSQVRPEGVREGAFMQVAN